MAEKERRIVRRADGDDIEGLTEEEIVEGARTVVRVEKRMVVDGNAVELEIEEDLA